MTFSQPVPLLFLPSSSLLPLSVYTLSFPHSLSPFLPFSPMSPLLLHSLSNSSLSFPLFPSFTSSTPVPLLFSPLHPLSNLLKAFENLAASWGRGQEVGGVGMMGIEAELGVYSNQPKMYISM